MKNLVCCAVIGASLAALPHGPADAEALLAADLAFAEDTAADGLEGWLRWFAPEAVLPVVSGALLRGAEERRAYYSSIGFPPAGFRWAPDSGALAESGELGYTVGTWELRPEGGVVAQDAEAQGGSYLTVWKRQADGGYRVLTDGGGRSDFRTRFETIPDAWSTTIEWSERAASGEYRFVLGNWSARTGDVERQGRFITVWRRAEDGAWEVETETGFEY